jgi:signal transduction histidine kinase
MNDAFFSNRLFEGISADVLGSIPIQEVDYPPQAVIFREGSLGATVMLVGKGRVQISKVGRKEKQEVLSLLEANDFFGELAVIDHGPRSATATALERSLIGEIDRAALDRLMESAPRVLPLNFTRVVVERLRYTNSLFIDELLQAERLTLLGTMVSSIVHDLKNPMSAIVSSVDYLERRSSDDYTHTLSGIIRSSADRMMLLTEELLDFARGTAKLRYRSTTADRLLKALDQEILLQVRSTPVRLVVEQRSTSELWLDEGRMTRCLSNIVKNALEAVKTAGKIRLVFEEQGAQLLITIADNGPGIPEELRARVFEPFVTYEKKGGTGLGLSIARSCVEAHGGRIWLGSETGKGTTFYVLLPRQKVVSNQ